jgi:hypothetical protein
VSGIREALSNGIVYAVLFVSTALAQNPISAVEAKNHIGENATVCGQVVSTHFAVTSRGRPTFLNFDSVYPKQIFTVVIWGSDRPKFGNPEDKYASKRICVAGKITEYRGVPEVAAYEPSQIRIQ